MSGKKLEIIYSQQASDFIEGRAYSNPRYFTTPRSNVSKVFIVGDWPAVREAYEALGVPVEQLGSAVAEGDQFEASPPADVAAKIADAFPAPGLGDWDGDGKPGGDAAGTGGLTKSEIIADLIAMNVDHDPRDKKADLLALRDEARAIRDA